MDTMSELHSFRLRVLSGTHAGAESDIPPGEYVIGSSSSNDLCISDWEGDSCCIRVPISGSSITMLTLTNDASVSMLTPELPFKLGCVLLVIRPLNSSYKDEDYWVKWLAEQAKPAFIPTTDCAPASTLVIRRRSWLPYGAILTVGLVFIGSMSWGNSYLAPTTKEASLRSSLTKKIETLPQTKLQVDWAGDDMLHVSGWVLSPQERLHLIRIFTNHSNIKVTNRYLVTQDVANTLSQATSESITVTPKRLDLFEATGSVHDLTIARRRLHQVLFDLGLNSSHLLDKMVEAPKDTRLFDAAFTDDDLRYRQLEDGSRVLQIASPPQY